MRYVFLDVDGVLNCRYTKNEPGKGCVNMSAAFGCENTRILQTILERFYEKYGKDQIKLVLSSSWRVGKDRYEYSMRSTLDEYLNQEGIYIDDEIPYLPYEYSRGAEIVAYLSTCDDVEGYIVLDDDQFDDFYKYRITRHLVRTSYEPQSGAGGLQKRHIKAAMRMMEKPVKEDERTIIREFSII